MKLLGLVLGLLCIGAYISFQPLLSLHWEMGSFAMTASPSASNCHCCKDACTCASQKNGCKVVAKTEGLRVSIKGAACQTESETTAVLMPTLRWFLVPDTRVCVCVRTWYLHAFFVYDCFESGQSISVLEKPPKQFCV
jgi:hypothetical protein